MSSSRARVRLRRKRVHRSQPGPRLVFLQDFLRKPLQVASIIPSSKFLERRVVRLAELARARCVVELGPGTGGTTRAILNALAPTAQLLVVEINPRFASLIRSGVADPRLIVHEGSAADLPEILEQHGLARPDVVLSGIPFSTMPRALGMAILRGVDRSLAPNGRFVAYQVRDRVEVLGRQVFGSARVQTELLNVPPMRVYRWDKAAAAARI